MRQKALPTSGKTSKLSIQYTGNTVIVSKYLEPVRFTEKPWLKVLFTDLLWEKNTIPAEKTSWKVQIIRQTNRVSIDRLLPKEAIGRPFSIMKMWHLLQKVSGQPSQVSCMTSSPSLLIQSSSALLQGKEVTYITTQLPTGLLWFPCHQRLYMMPFPVPSSGGPHGTQEDIFNCIQTCTAS
jgi:hypothetical protein